MPVSALILQEVLGIIMVAAELSTGLGAIMTRAELTETIRNGENSFVEFKLDSIENFKLARELVAFANAGGGRVLLGVTDDGTVAGITRPNLEEWVMTTCRDKIRPELVPYFQYIQDVEPGKGVGIVTVLRGATVHALWHNGHRTYFTRVGSQSRDASQTELRRIFQQRGELRAEIMPVSGTSIKNLDFLRLLDCFSRARRQETPDDNDKEGWQTLLVNTELLSEEEGACTMAGLLLFGEKPTRFIPHAAVDAAAYPGTEKDYSALERMAMRNPLTALFRKNETLKVVDPGLVEEVVYFVRRNTGVTSYLQDAIRIDRPAYPEEVVREAIVNALVHRDYTMSGTTIEVSVYSDRIEIISPGRLPNGITPARMRAGCRSTRNQLLVDTMRDYTYLEHTGLGVPRKLIKGMLAHNGTEPDLIEQDERFIVRLWKQKKA